MAPPYILKPVNDNGENQAIKLLRSLRKRRLRGLVAAVSLEEALSTIETTGVQGIPETNGSDTIYFEIVGGQYCIAHAQNPDNPDEIYVLTAFKMRDYATGRNEAWRLWRTVVNLKP